MTAFRQNIIDIEKLFATNAWTTRNVTAYPANYSGEIPANDEWVRINVLQGNSTFRYSGSQSTNGLVNINIFVPVGQGVRRAHEIADYIETLFKSSTISGVQFTNSFLTTVGVDSANSGLFRLDYTINFSNYN